MCAGAQGSAVELGSEESLSGMCVESKGGNYANLAVLYSPVCSREAFFTDSVKLPFWWQILNFPNFLQVFIPGQFCNAVETYFLRAPKLWVSSAGLEELFFKEQDYTKCTGHLYPLGVFLVLFPVD